MRLPWADNVKYTYDETAGRWEAATNVYFRDKQTHVDIYGYYPYSSPASIEAYAFEVARDQSTEAANGQLGGYESSDFLWAKAEDIAPTTSATILTFKHIMAGIQVSMVEGTGFNAGEFLQIEKALLVSHTIRKATIDLATGKVTPVGEVPETDIVPVKNGDGWRAVVVPQTVSGNTTLFTLTVDGTAYVFRKNEPFEYMAGKLHKFTIEVSKKGENGLEFKLIGQSITTWETDNVSHDATAREYVIIDCEKPGTLSECIAEKGKDGTKIKNLKVTGKIDKRDFDYMRDGMVNLQSLNLKDVKIDSYNENYKADKIPRDVFLNKYSLIRIVLPDNLSEIGEQAFYGTNLTGALIIPEGVTTIGYSAFYNCPFSGTLTLPQTLEVIGDNTFKNCGFIGQLELPASIKIIGQQSFYFCTGFTGNLTLPDNLEEIGEYAFYFCSGFTGSLTIPSKIKSIPNNCFYYCGFDGQLNLHNDIINIESRAFENCKFRGSLNLPESLLKIGEYAFERNLFSSIHLPASLVTIGNRAFCGCERLTGVVEIPEEIISIPQSLFGGCSQLEGGNYSQTCGSHPDIGF